MNRKSFAEPSLRVIVVLGLLICGACDKEDSGSNSSDVAWAADEKWRELEIGLSMDEVRDILGEPTEILEDRGFTRWKYGRADQTGVMTFEDGQLTFWKGPNS